MPVTGRPVWSPKVRAGAKRLDRLLGKGKWEAKVNLETLDIGASPTNKSDILSQLFGTYKVGLMRLGISEEEAMKCAFTPTAKNWSNHDANEAWGTLIYERLNPEVRKERKSILTALSARRKVRDEYHATPSSFGLQAVAAQ